MEIPIRDWTFTHWWVRPVVKLWFDFYHKHVSYSGQEQIDWEKPIIFTPSHQSAFTDALCLILPTRYTNNRFIYPLIRADAFGHNPAVDWVLTAFHMLPVYRPKDNVDIRKRNDSIFSDCYEILSKNRNLLIHPEGNCFAIKRVRRFKKGFARIALGAEEYNDFSLGVHIVPVGINYRRVTKARGGIHVRFGSPVAVAGYREDYIDQPASAIGELTAKVEKEVKKVTVDIQSDTYYSMIEDVIDLSKNHDALFNSKAFYSVEELYFEKRKIERLEQSIKDTKTAAHLKEAVGNVLGIIKDHGLSKKLPLSQIKHPLVMIGKGFGYLLLSPIFLYGCINNIIPWYLIDKLASRIKDKQFINSARMASGLAVFPLFYLIQTTIFGYLSGSLLWTLAYLFSLPLSGILSLNIWEQWKSLRQQLRLIRMSSDKKRSLRQKMDKIINLIGKETPA